MKKRTLLNSDLEISTPRPGTHVKPRPQRDNSDPKIEALRKGGHQSQLYAKPLSHGILNLIPKKTTSEIPQVLNQAQSLNTLNPKPSLLQIKKRRLP